MPQPARSRSHTRHRRRSVSVPPAERPLDGPEDALRVVLAAAADPPRAETIALVLDHARCGLTCLVCDGASAAHQVAELGAFVVRLAATEPAFGAVVLASARPTDGIEPTAADEAVFLQLRHDLVEHDVDLLDWFLLADGSACSVAETIGACWRWASEPPP